MEVHPGAECRAPGRLVMLTWAILLLGVVLAGTLGLRAVASGAVKAGKFFLFILLVLVILAFFAVRTWAGR